MAQWLAAKGSMCPAREFCMLAGGNIGAAQGRRMRLFSNAGRGLLAAALLLTGLPGAWAQDWPARPIKIVTPLAAGGAADVIGHAVADAFAAATKLPVIIDNRPGGGGTLAAVTVARAEPDGTLLLGTAVALNV